MRNGQLRVKSFPKTGPMETMDAWREDCQAELSKKSRIWPRGSIPSILRGCMARFTRYVLARSSFRFLIAVKEESEPNIPRDWTSFGHSATEWLRCI